jgi:hypothetical protein
MVRIFTAYVSQGATGVQVWRPSTQNCVPLLQYGSPTFMGAVNARWAEHRRRFNLGQCHLAPRVGYGTHCRAESMETRMNEECVLCYNGLWNGRLR